MPDNCNPHPHFHKLKVCINKRVSDNEIPLFVLVDIQRHNLCDIVTKVKTRLPT